ncbi:hypothetical protein LOK49_LG08G02028 [Camellia lanceoleosa]|uniref:Uncharacterized protein n=1 Tax=Camellia lanceoleosa TaxID=1840588 RepID=A0ACC0GRN2_9ERIC|nr:hypothetical protein LOK49_LG08G02028 [Camellia lanceoleosa]
MGLSASKRVSRSFDSSPDFNSACDSVFEECLNLAQHAFPGVKPYQLRSATDRLHHSLLSTSHPHPLVKKWVPNPPTRSQVDNAYELVVTRRSSNENEEEQPSLGPIEFKAFATEVFTNAVVSNAGKAVLQRVPIGIAGIAGIGVVTRSGKDLVGTVIGVYALGVASSIYLSLAG